MQVAQKSGGLTLDLRDRSVDLSHEGHRRLSTFLRIVLRGSLGFLLRRGVDLKDASHDQQPQESADEPLTTESDERYPRRSRLDAAGSPRTRPLPRQPPPHHRGSR
jgi:hypothetical protein